MLRRNLLFFDGDCATCHRLIRFILARPQNVRERFRFLPLTVLYDHPFIRERDSKGEEIKGESVVIIKNGMAYQRSAAIFAIIQALGWPWNLLLIFRLLPSFLLDSLYELFARNRYRLFGKAKVEELCEVPDPAIRPLFLAEIPRDTTLFPFRAGRFLEAEWVNLVFMNFVVPRDLLSPYLPEGTELDLWEGQALASIVAFQMQQTQVMGLSIPFHEDFEEVNLRFYVLRHVEGAHGPELRRGVVFVKEIVPRSAIAWVARLLYNENYVARSMRHAHHFSERLSTLEYGWQTPKGSCLLKAELKGEPEASRPGSLEEFITEHYWGYAKQRDGSTVEYEVEHPRWPVWRLQESDASLSGPVAQDYGPELAAYLQKPFSICAAKGSAVRVFAGRRMDLPSASS